MKVYDATDTVVGRLAATAAKQALSGETVRVVNCEKAIITGGKEAVFRKYQNKGNQGGPIKGPFMPKMPDRFVRRIIRGMLPYKQSKGRSAFKRVMCYLGVPQELKQENLIKLEKANVSKIPNLKYTTVGELCKLLGGKG